MVAYYSACLADLLCAQPPLRLAAAAAVATVRRRPIRLCLLAASDQRQPTNPPTLTVCCTAWPQGLPADEKKKRMIEFGSSRLLLCYLVV